MDNNPSQNNLSNNVHGSGFNNYSIPPTTTVPSSNINYNNNARGFYNNNDFQRWTITTFFIHQSHLIMTFIPTHNPINPCPTTLQLHNTRNSTRNNIHNILTKILFKMSFPILLTSLLTHSVTRGVTNIAAQVSHVLNSPTLTLRTMMPKFKRTNN